MGLVASNNCIFGFFLLEAKKHVCIVGLMKGRLDLHKSEIG